MKISVAIPSSVLVDAQHIREKTAKLGLISRVCSIYRVSNIYIFNDASGNYARDGDFSKLILEYLETPQYLRRTIFPLMDSLRYAGALPPLRIPHHKSTSRAQDIRQGEIREALVSKQGNQYKADAGLGVPIPIEGEVVNTGRNTVLFTSSYPNLKCKVVDREYSKEYWGYRVIKRKSISELLKEYTDAFTIFTSRDGQIVEQVWDEFCIKVQKSSKVLVLFGSPKLGLPAMMEKEGLNQKTSRMINTISGQGVATVRTEEAMAASLSLINVACNLKMTN